MKPSNQEKNHSVPVLIASIIAVSTAAPLAKMATAQPIAIGFWRTLVVGLLLVLTVRARHFRIPLRLWALALFAGILLAGHFWSWFSSLHYTSTLRSTVLVCLNPIWVGLLEGFIFRKMPSSRYWIGVVVALVGVGLMSGQSSEELSLYGDFLAVLGGVLGAVYLIVGRFVRQKMEVGPYGALLCLGCAFWLLMAALINNESLTGYGWETWAILGVMAIGPQLTGHIGLNYAVRYISAATVAMLLLLEPVGAALLAGILLQEIPSNFECVGAVVILAGVAIGLRRESKPTQHNPSSPTDF